jgi:hypothetical protein
MTGQSPFGGGVKMMVIGAIAAGMAFLLAKSLRIQKLINIKIVEG